MTTARFYPPIILSDKQWDRVVWALAAKGPKADAAIAVSIAKQLDEQRAKRAAR